ncbi:MULTISPECIES: hypothetical protein [unclassified Streptomyces]|uniref:hypothetical protein n=1 Tax=unclassified Streptomyces TaxID=2593676 RepID=UPI003332543D
MTEFGWRRGPDDPFPEQIRRAWPATVSALPIGTPITGQVVGRQPFGIFIRIHGSPHAVGMADTGSMPSGGTLPALGDQVSGTVVRHTDSSFQVRIRLTEWLDAD